MKTVSDYESISHIGSRDILPVILEAYKGSDIVAWFGNIERQLKGLISEYESARNHAYVDKLRKFLETWRNNRITGSINREQLDVLQAAADQLSVDTWKIAGFFESVRDQLRKLIAAAEELPVGEPPPEAERAATRAKAGAEEPPTPAFGAEETPGQPSELPPGAPTP